MSAESNIKVGDRVRLRKPGSLSDGRVGVVDRVVGPEGIFLVVLDKGYLSGCRADELERLPDPAQAESDLMTRLEEGVEPPRSKPRPQPTMGDSVAGAIQWWLADTELRRMHVACGDGFVEFHANLSPYPSARRLRLHTPFSADAVSCFLDGMMMEPDRGLCVTVNRSAEVA